MFNFSNLVLDLDSKIRAKEIRFKYVTFFSLPFQFFNTDACDPELEKEEKIDLAIHR